METRIHFHLKFVFSLLILSFLFGSCSDGSAENVSPPNPSEPTQTSTEALSEAEQDEAGGDDFGEELGPAPDPIAVEIISEDETLLRGTYYPSSKPSAPLIMLMHWAPGDQTDWRVIAPWLQNRGLISSSTSGEAPWLDPSWFPDLPAQYSFNVFTFTFRNCEGGCSSFERGKWYEDVQAAVDTAVQLDVVDPTRVIMIGASIGSDGAVDGCAYLNHKAPGTCLGAIALSPGNYLTVDFEDKVKELDPNPVWCLYAEVDAESAPLCGNIEENNYRRISYPASMIYGNGHGMNLIEVNQDPNPLDLLIQFLNTVL